MKILVLNAGSSSQKSCLYQLDSGSLPEVAISPLWEAKIDWTQKSDAAVLKVKTKQGGKLEEELPVHERQKAIAHMLDSLCQGTTQVINKLDEIDIVGHRVVHGGKEYQDVTLITPEVKAKIKDLTAIAPEHNPVNLEGIEAIEQLLSNVPQVAVFDTAFHSTLPLSAAVYPIPYKYFEQGIRRYGFHGINHQYCAQRTAQLLGRDLQSLRLITCHLGNGCSLTAISEGKSIDTTMGFTPLEGLMMGSRSGSVDPGILIYLMRQGTNVEELNEILNRGSGLKGVSGLSNDMRQIESAKAKGNFRAQLAFDMYVHSVCTHIGAMLASLGRLDALVFTGGIGENQPDIRAKVCQAFEFLGLKLDVEKNVQSPPDTDISTPNSAVRVLIVEAQEDWAIATECWKLAKT